ncbi:immunity 49 family protein [Nocardiopsis potens]|uniref:immunity 49 family protein n=1 Tax=Nocardiopsis potens TaxID=1246458 RepID=UPI00034C0507|nr:immunity 49 family protein [Nocardiopsis potens]
MRDARISALAGGERIAVERPKFRKRRTAESIEVLDEWSRNRLDRFPAEAEKNLSGNLHLYSDSELDRFRRRSVHDPEGRDPRQAEALELSSQYYSAAFEVAVSAGGTAEFTLGGRSVSQPCPEDPGEMWLSGLRRAAERAIASASPERLAALLAYPRGLFPKAAGIALIDSYAEALLTHLRGEPAGPALDRAFADLADFDAWGMCPAPVAALHRLTTGDREGFACALSDTLAEFRDVYRQRGLKSASDGLINIEALALACLARSRGWDVPIDSPYLPKAVLDRAAGVSFS